jgi:hypothetical protein
MARSRMTSCADHSRSTGWCLGKEDDFHKDSLLFSVYSLVLLAGGWEAFKVSNVVPIKENSPM